MKFSVRDAQWDSAGPNLKMDLDEAVEFQYSLTGKGFFSLLFNLFMMAQGENYDKLKSQFPNVAKEFEKYKTFGNIPDVVSSDLL